MSDITLTERLKILVEKTVKLLELRNYRVYAEDLDKVPAEILAESVDPDKPGKYVIWVYPESKTIGVAGVRELKKAIDEEGADRGMIVGAQRLTPAAVKEAKVYNIELVTGGFASFSLLSHELVPKHEIMKPEEVRELLQKYGITKDRLPRIFASDPAAKIIGAKPGDVLKITRKSDTAGISIYYRVVVAD